jgi:hypothetical protein
MYFYILFPIHINESKSVKIIHIIQYVSTCII